MSNLKDQLVKAGLVSQKQARQAGHKERVDRKQDGGTEAERAAQARTEEARRQMEAQRERDREQARQQQAEQAAREQELQAQARRQSGIDAAFREGRIESWGGARTYSFTDGTRIESLGLSDTAARLLADGKAAIVRTQDPTAPYTLLAAGSAQRLRDADPARIVVLHPPESERPKP